MAVKALIFGIDDLYLSLKPFYERAVKNGSLEIIAYSFFNKNSFELLDAFGKRGVKNIDAEIIIVSAQNTFYNKMKQLEQLGFPKSAVVDGKIFQIDELDFNRFMKEKICYGVINNAHSFGENVRTLYKRVYNFKNNRSTITFGKNTYIDSQAAIVGRGEINLGHFSSIASNIMFELSTNNFHNYHNISTFEPLWLNWQAPQEFFSQSEFCKIDIGSDVWIGRGSILKSTNPNKPLKIGDGAVIASDSVVVKNVPPYAIVGGNPARIIKYRFSEDIIEALLRIKWWNWDIDKIYENFKYFNRIEEFIAMHDKGV